MVREWATVADWQNGVATLICEQKSGCSNCSANKACGMKVLDKLNNSANHRLQVAWQQPLNIGQRVEIGIPEASLLRSALLVYILPLTMLFTGATLANVIIHSDISLIIGGVIGGALGFLIARLQASKIEQKITYQPVILQVNIASLSIDNSD